MRPLAISAFLCLFFLSYTFAKEVSSAGPDKRDVELFTTNAATICGEGTLYYFFTNSPSCTPAYSATM